MAVITHQDATDISHRDADGADEQVDYRQHDDSHQEHQQQGQRLSHGANSR